MACRRERRRGLLVPLAISVASLIAVQVGSTESGLGQLPATTAPQSSVTTEAEARAACGTACHAFPPPDILPRRAWRDTVARMMLISQGALEPAGPTGTAGRSVLLTPDMQRILRFYLAHAPASLPAASPWPAADSSRFARREFSPAGQQPGPAVSHVRFLDIDRDGKLEVVASDMRHGSIAAGRPWDPNGRFSRLGGVRNPANFSLFDFDGDGRNDFLISDLGQFQPSDHTDASIVWMRAGTAGRYTPFALEGWPRVADVQAGDFNGDGKADLAVAAFGWRKSGRIVVLENQTRDYSNLAFVPHVVDPRSGGIHAVPTDINGDGRLDVAALLAQQHETVIAYINDGGFSFRPETIFTAPHPNWGSSGIDLVDLDRDKDLDVLLTHGDTFDDDIVKPYHGVMWLENRGGFPYVPHALAELPGAFRAQAGDLDGDGDLDIVACAFIAGGSDVDESNMPALVWLEQVTPGVFERRTLARRPPRHATLDLADYDADGDLDLVVGLFATTNMNLPWIEVWENRTKN